MTVFVNFLGGPCVGKSVAAAAMFAQAKQRGYSAEMIPEFAKIAVWEGVPITLGRQLQFLGDQIQREEMLAGKVDFVFSDGPAALVAEYTGAAAQEFVYAHQVRLRNHGHTIRNFLVPRRFDYDPKGRIHTEAEARDIDQHLADYLETEPLPGAPWPF